MTVRRKRWLGAAVCAWALAAATPGAARAESPSAGPIRVTFVAGEAHVLRAAHRHTTEAGPQKTAPWQRLRPQARLAEGDAVRTSSDARLELTMPDGSRLRLAEKTQVSLERSHFGRSARQVSVRMWLGRLWAHVARRIGSDSAFEVRVQNAVAGVRGTSFAVVAQADLSSVVKVYTGTVGVKKVAAAGAGRVAISGPRRVDRQQWEEIIATQMRQVRVTQLGEIQPVEDFVDLGDDLEWAQWNRTRDGTQTPR